jgi:hypothetical protein
VSAVMEAVVEEVVEAALPKVQLQVSAIMSPCEVWQLHSRS